MSPWGRRICRWVDLRGDTWFFDLTWEDFNNLPFLEYAAKLCEMSR